MRDYRLSPDARADLDEIARYTLEHWGDAQQRRYAEALESCFEALAAGTAIGRCPVPHRAELRQVRCLQHHVFARVAEGEVVVILAVLHVKMDLMTRLHERLDGPA